METPSDRRFLAVARRRRRDVFPELPQQPGFHERRARLGETIEWLIGICASHSRFFWGFRLHGLFAPDGTPRAFTLASPERDVGLELPERASRAGGEILTLERHGARTLTNLRVRTAQRFLALAACIALNHELGRPSRALVDYVA